MYKVILVDDEKQITDGLSRMIRWGDIGFAVCATARNGAEAIPLIESMEPDLVLTDVRMPEMDGLKMVKYVRENIANDVEFIILSGYSDFQYAQQAMRYNVKSYILKPIDEATLYGALIDIKNLLEEKENRKSLRIRKYINDLIGGAQPEDGALTLASEEQSGLRYIAIERRMDFSALPLYPDEQAGEDIAKCIAEKIGEQNMRFVLRHDRNRCHMVAGRSLLGGYENDAKRMALSIGEYLRTVKSIQANILIGRKVAGFKDIHESMQSILLCRNKLFYLSKPSIVVYDDIREEKFRKVYEDNGSAIRIISAFRKNDMEKLTESFEALTEHFSSLQVVPEVVRIQLDGVMASILQILSERQKDMDEVLECYSSCKKAQDRANLCELARMTLQFCLHCVDFSVNSSKYAHNDVIEKVARYVDESYAQPIKINDIAERFYMNPAYLGQQFAKKKGCSLNHYINSVRIEKAKELLLNTGRKIYEIALDTGFEDPNYFSSKFFEYTGFAPSDYRGRNREVK